MQFPWLPDVKPLYLSMPRWLHILGTKAQLPSQACYWMFPFLYSPAPQLAWQVQYQKTSRNSIASVSYYCWQLELSVTSCSVQASSGLPSPWRTSSDSFCTLTGSPMSGTSVLQTKTGADRRNPFIAPTSHVPWKPQQPWLFKVGVWSTLS